MGKLDLYIVAMVIFIKLFSTVFILTSNRVLADDDSNRSSHHFNFLESGKIINKSNVNNSALIIRNDAKRPLNKYGQLISKGVYKSHFE